MTFSDIINGSCGAEKAIQFIILNNYSSLFITLCHRLFNGFKSRTGKLLWFLAVAKKKPRKGQEKTPIFNEKREYRISDIPFNFNMVGGVGFEPAASTV